MATPPPVVASRKRKRPQKNAGRSRLIAWTLLNFSADEFKLASDQTLFEQKEIRYICWAPQKCPTTGTPHLQGFTQFFQAVRVVPSMKWLSTRVHSEAVYSTARQAADYILKDEKKTNVGPVFEWGRLCEKSGERTDLQDVAIRIRDGESLSKVAAEYPATFAQYSRGFTELARLTARPQPFVKARSIEIHVVYGESGLGKSERIKDMLVESGASSIIVDMDELAKGWWPSDYKGESSLFLDEFRGCHLKPSKFMALADGSIRQLAVKGGYAENKAQVVYITTPDHPRGWWPRWYAKTTNNWKQIRRRITACFRVTGTTWQDATWSKIDLDDSTLYPAESQAETN